MIKRASTILLTLFLLLSSAQVWAAIICGQTVGGSNFQIKPGTSGNSLEDIQTFGNDVFSANTADYSLSSGLLTIHGDLNKDVLTHTISGLPTSGNNEYTITFNYKSNGSTEFRFKWKEGTNDKYGNSIQAQQGPYSFTAKSTNGMLSYTLEEYGNQKADIEITSITITGCIEQQIVSDNGDDLCAGEDNKFTALGVDGNITWTLDGQPIKGAKIVGNTITFAPTEGGTLKAVAGSTSLTYKFTTRFCCAVNADRADVSIETFTFKNSGDKMEQIDNGIRSNISTGYNMAPSLGGIGEDKYAIIKSTDGTWSNWYNANGATIVYGHTKENSDIDNATLSKFNQANGKNSSYDGFIAVNCNVNTYSKNKDKSTIFEYRTTGICKNTYHDFSAFISNVDAKVGEADINVKFLVTDGAGNKLLDRSTGDVKCGDQSWKEYGGSFETKDNEAIVLTLYNNNDKATPNADGNIVGNDVGVDDIRFSRCVPRINVHFNTELTAFTSDECNNTNKDKTINLYIGHHDYNVAEILDGAYFIVLQNKGTGWERISGMSSGPIAFDKTNAQNMVTATITPNQGKTEYKAIVASSKADVEKVESGNTTNLSTTCAVYNITKPNEIAVLDPACIEPCIDSNKPKMNSYFECPTEAKEIDLTTLIKEINTVDGKSVDLTKISDAGELCWYKQDPEDETKFYEITNTKVPFPSQGKERYSVSFKQKDDATQTYCISDTTQFTVGIKETIEFDVNTTSIMGCIGDLSSDESRTFKIKNLVPTSLTNNDVNYIWSLLNTETNKYETIATATTDSYIVEPGNGKIKVSITPKNSSVQVCPSTETELSYSIADNPKFELDGVSVPCFDKLKDDGIVVSLKELSGSTMLKIKRKATDENNKVSTTVFTSFEEAGSFKVINYNEEAEFAFKDTYFDAQYFSADFDATKIASVQYDIVLGIETTDCKDEISTETFDISSTNNFSLRPSDNVKDINDDKNIAEYHICEGEQVIVTSTYNEQDGGLKPGEIYEWYVKKGNGEFILDTTDPSLKDSQSYTIPEIDETTTIKVVLVADPNFTDAETCGGEAIITIIVDKKPEVTAENIELCADDKSKKMKVTAKGTYSYEWTPNTGLSNAAIQNPGIISLTTSTDYSLKVTSGTCTITIPEIKVTVIPLPEIGNITIDTDEEGKNVLNVEINGTDTYKYSLDDITYSESTPTNLPIGWNKLYVSDSKGCKSSKLFEVEPTPIYPEKYFTPNGDGVNETWDIENINMYPAYIVEIFDRYSKRLFIQRVGSFNTGGNNTVDGDEFTGWDGMYNGHAMPSDDYWYLITVEEIRKQYTGHFTLKR